LSILWEWVHKQARLNADDEAAGVRAEDPFTLALCARLIAEEYDKLQRAGNRDVHDDSKHTTLPIAREIVETYIAQPIKLPWYVDLLNITLDAPSLETARARIAQYAQAFAADGTRVTENVDLK
jgi:malate synthase